MSFELFGVYLSSYVSHIFCQLRIFALLSVIFSSLSVTRLSLPLRGYSDAQ